LSKFLTFSQRGNIWRMFFTDNKLIAGETRDIINKLVSFFSLNYENRTVLIKNLQLNEKWWLSIANVNDSLIFLSSYRKPDMPEHLGITVLDIFSGVVRWQKNDLTFLFTDNEFAYTYKARNIINWRLKREKF